MTGSTPHRILLAVSTSRYSERLVELAMQEAHRMQEEVGPGTPVVIDILYIIEQAGLDRLAQSITDAGLIGLEVQEDLIQELAREHDRTARRRVEQVEAAAAAQGIETRAIQLTGSFAETVLEQAEQLGSEVILLTRADRPFISRILFGSEADKVARLARQEGLGKVIVDE